MYCGMAGGLGADDLNAGTHMQQGYPMPGAQMQEGYAMPPYGLPHPDTTPTVEGEGNIPSPPSLNLWSPSLNRAHVCCYSQRGASMTQIHSAANKSNNARMTSSNPRACERHRIPPKQHKIPHRLTQVEVFKEVFKEVWKRVTHPRLPTPPPPPPRLTPPPQEVSPPWTQQSVSMSVSVWVWVRGRTAAATSLT